MKLLGFNINKINAEKTSDSFNELKIENNIHIDSINEMKADFFKKDEAVIKVDFTYQLNYNPNIAKLSFSGNVLILVDSKESKEMVKQWETKTLPEEVKINVFNIILRKTNIRALELEDELNIPLHIKFPFLKEQKK